MDPIPLQDAYALFRMEKEAAQVADATLAHYDNAVGNASKSRARTPLATCPAS